MTSFPQPLRRTADPDPGSPRAAPEKPPLPRVEAALVAVTALHLCFLPWALGAMNPGSQLASLGAALLGFLLAALPRIHDGRLPDATQLGESPLARLWRKPVFWTGPALLAYIAVQACNPAWRFASDGQSWWLVPLERIRWLPAGVDGPFARSNPWRAFVVLASLWLVVCSVWAGFQRRKSYRLLFGAMALNAFALAVLDTLQQVTHASRIFWHYRPSTDSFIASFIYRNHAGAYFNLMVALAAGLAWWHHQRARQRLERAGPAAWAFALTAGSTGLMVIFSYSRMSTLLLLAFTVLAGAALAFRRAARGRRRPEALPLLLALVALLAAGLVASQSEKVRKRFADLAAHPLNALQGRNLVRAAATDMLADRWLFGWGAGCFRYGFPLYAQHYPRIYYSDGPGRRLYWEHAHNDLVEFPLELGVAGLLPVLAALGAGLRALVQRRFWRYPISLCLGIGCALTFAHAWVDFVFQNPAVLLTWATLLTAAIRWPGFEKASQMPARDTRGERAAIA